MFGIKNPAKMLGMLKMFGVNPETLLPQVESFILKEFQKMEEEAGGNIMAVAVMDNTKSHFVVSLFKVLPDGKTIPWKAFPLSEMTTFLKNLQNDKTDEPSNPIIRAAELQPGTKPGESAQPDAEPEPNPGPGADEYPAFQ